jgi:hypothetical protein
MVRKAGITMIIVGWFCMVGTVGATENATDDNLFSWIIKGFFWATVFMIGFLIKERAE